jgi:8-oxo-dGTP pyrophosphatase MutT (NUDIX family)
MLSTQAVHSLLHSPLPGALAHCAMEPQPPLTAGPGEYREAAVLVLLSPLGYRVPDHLDDFAVTLIRRAPSTHHSYELAFPGGRREGDEPLRATALREASEEIGVEAGGIKVLGTLSTVNTVTSRTLILPVLAISKRPVDFRTNPEVAALIHVPLGSLRKPGSQNVEITEHPEVGPRRVPYFAIGGAKLWGASAKIMAELLAVVYGNDCLR